MSMTGCQYRPCDMLRAALPEPLSSSCAQGHKAESLQQAPATHDVTVLRGGCNLGKLPDCLLNYRPPAPRRGAQITAPAAATSPLHSARAQPAVPGQQLSPTPAATVLEPAPVPLERARSCSAESDELPLDMLAAKHRADFAGRWPTRQAAAAAPAVPLGVAGTAGTLQPKPHHELSAAPSLAGSLPSNLYIAQQMQPHVACCAGEALAGQQARQQPETRQPQAAGPDALSQQPEVSQEEGPGQAAAADMVWEPQEQPRELSLEPDALAEPCGGALHHQHPAQEAEAEAGRRPSANAALHQQPGAKVALAGDAGEAAACQHVRRTSEQDTTMAAGSQQSPLAAVGAVEPRKDPVAEADADAADAGRGPGPAAHAGQAERPAGQHQEGAPAASAAVVGNHHQQMGPGQTEPAQQLTQDRTEGLLHQGGAQDVAQQRHQPSFLSAQQAAAEGPVPSAGSKDLSTGTKRMSCSVGFLRVAALTVVLLAGAHRFLLTFAGCPTGSPGRPDAALLSRIPGVQQGEPCCCLNPEACAQSPRETPACTVSSVARKPGGHRAVPAWRPSAARPAEEAAKVPAAREGAAAAGRIALAPSALTDQEDSAPAAVAASQLTAVHVKTAGGGSAPTHPTSEQPVGRAADLALSEGLPQTEEAMAAERSQAVQTLMSRVLWAVFEGSQASHVALTATGESSAEEPPVQAVLEGREASTAASAGNAEEAPHGGQPSAAGQPEQLSDANQTCCQLPGSPQQQMLATQLPPGTCAVDPAVLKAEEFSKPAVATTPAAGISRHGDLAPAPASGVLKAETQQRGGPQREPEGCNWAAAQPEPVPVPASASVEPAELPVAAAGLKAEVGGQQGRAKLSPACMVPDCRQEAFAATVSAQLPGIGGSEAATAEAESLALQEPPAPVGVGAAPETFGRRQPAGLAANTLRLQLQPPSEADQAEAGCSSGKDTCTPEPGGDTCILQGATSLLGHLPDT